MYIKVGVMRISVALAALALTGCANLSLNDVYQNPTIEYKSTNITGVSFDDLSGTSVVQIKNSNPYNLPVSALGAQLWLDGNEWLALNNDTVSGLPADGTVAVAFEWDVIFEQLLSRASDAYEKGQADFTLKLAPTLDVPVIGAKTFDWAADFSVPVPKIPTVKVHDWAVAGATFTSVTLAIDLELDNPNVFAINTQDWILGVTNDSKSLVDLKLADADVKAQGKSIQQVEVKLSLVDVGLALMTSLKSGQWPESVAMDWSGQWFSPDLDFDLPKLAGQLVSQ